MIMKSTSLQDGLSMAKLEIKENVMPTSYVRHLYNVVTDVSFDWHYIHDATFEEQRTGSPSFSHLLYNNGYKSPHFNTFIPPLLEAVGEVNLIRVRLGCLLSNILNPQNNTHVDFEYPHMVGLYYINDADGPTCVWTEDGLQKVEAQSNRFVLFDGKYKHASTCPMAMPSRFVITYNFTQ